MKSTGWRKWGTLGLALAGCLSLAACSNDGKKSKTATPSTAAGASGKTVAANPVATGGTAAPEGATVETTKVDESPKGAAEPDKAPVKAADPTKKKMAAPRGAAKTPAKSGKAPAAKTADKAPVKAPIKLGAKPVVRSTPTHIVTVVPTAGAGGGSFTVSLKPKPGWKINQDFPTSLKIAAPAGVKVPKAKLGKSDASNFGEKKASFKVKFSSDAGSKKFSAQFKFAMCTEATCDPKKESLAFVVDVK